MKTWYNIEVQMLGENERNFALDYAIGLELGFAEDDIDERELYKMTAVFYGEYKPQRMESEVIKVLQDHPEVFYIDVMYREECDPVPGRFVVWNDGRVQRYVGKIVFDEVTDHE